MTNNVIHHFIEPLILLQNNIVRINNIFEILNSNQFKDGNLENLMF